MARGTSIERGPERERPPSESGDGLECLVLTVSALSGDRAASLLAGLADPLRPRALALLACVERTGRAERHAALASAFAPPRHVSGSKDIPGLLGERLRNRLAPGGAPRGAPDAGATERWARRLALESSVRDGLTVGSSPRSCRPRR